MAKSSTERTRDYRQRGIEARRELERVRQQAADYLRQAQAVNEALQAENADLRDRLAGSAVPAARCRQCGGELACPRCWQGGEHE